MCDELLPGKDGSQLPSVFVAMRYWLRNPVINTQDAVLLFCSISAGQKVHVRCGAVEEAWDVEDVRGITPMDPNPTIIGSGSNITKPQSTTAS